MGEDGVVNSGERGSKDMLVTVVPWHGRTTPLSALGDEGSEIKAQRTLCLEALVGLAPHEEELGKNEYTEVSNLCSCVLSNPVCRWGVDYDSVLWTHSFCSLKQHGLLFQTVTVPSTFSED